MSFDGKRKSVRRFVSPFREGALRLESVKRAVDLDGGEPFSAQPEPLLLRLFAIEIVAPAFVIPSARADVCFAGHFGEEYGATLRACMRQCAPPDAQSRLAIEAESL